MADSHRLLQIRNPWSKRGIPKQTYHSSTPNFDDDTVHGTFWIEYHALSQTFKTLYLNWNPRLFGFFTQRHFSITPGGSDVDVGANGQYVLRVEGNGVVWVLVERHYLGFEEGWEGYIGLALFAGDERVYSYTRPLNRTEYVDSNYTLLKIPSMPANTPHTILIHANDKISPSPQPPRFFTLTAYANYPLSLSEPRDVLPYETRVRGVWERGVSYKSPQSTFGENPQWKWVVGAAVERGVKAGRVEVLLEAEDEETAVNVTIAWSAGKRLARLSNQDILCQSGEYVPHHAKTSSKTVKLSTQYTLIASRFEDLSHYSPTSFTLILRSNIPSTLEPLPASWAGKYRHQVHSRWDPDDLTKEFILSTPRLTGFSVRATTPEGNGFVRLVVRTFEGETVWTSSEGEGRYADLAVGEMCAVSGDLVGGEEYVLCVERLDENGGEFVLDFLADGELEPIEI